MANPEVNRESQRYRMYDYDNVQQYWKEAEIEKYNLNILRGFIPNEPPESSIHDRGQGKCK